MAAQVPNIFVEQYDQGQKKIRADLMDENFAYVCTQLDANAAAADAAQGTADGKANADLDDVTEAGKAIMANASMPSSQSISLSVPASGGTIVAPADGWLEFKFAKVTGASYGRAVLAGAAYSSLEVTTSNYNYISLPVRSGINVQISYQNTQLMSLRFLYARGSVPTN